MLIIPAIDLKDGHCVRLKQGIMEEATVFSESPASMAEHWLQQGARRLHLVDLNGAFAGKPKNGPSSQTRLFSWVIGLVGSTFWRFLKTLFLKFSPSFVYRRFFEALTGRYCKRLKTA